MIEYTRAPRTHGEMTLAEAADWLSAVMQPQTWTPRAVLGRLHKWEHSGASASRMPLDALRVVVPRGAVLVDLLTGEHLDPLVRPRTLLVAGADDFLRELLDDGKGMPLALVPEDGALRWRQVDPMTLVPEPETGRWRPLEPLPAESIRLSGAEVEALLPESERFALFARSAQAADFLAAAGLGAGGKVVVDPVVVAVEARSEVEQPASGAQGKVVVAPPAEPKRHHLRGRDDVLSGPIRKAVEAVQSKGGKVTTATVWVELQEVAIQEFPPFLGVTPSDAKERGLRCTGPNGQTKVFTRDALRKRLNPGARGRSR